MKTRTVVLGGAFLTAAAIVSWHVKPSHRPETSALPSSSLIPAGPAELVARGSEVPEAALRGSTKTENPKRAGDIGAAKTAPAVRPPVVAGAIRARTAKDSVTPTRETVLPEAAPLPRRRVIIEPLSTQQASPGMSPVVVSRGIEIELADGAKEPLALVEEESPLTTAQERAVAGIANDFAAKMEQAAATSEVDDIEPAWRREQEQADAEYYALFGVEAFNRRSAEVGAAAAVPPATVGGQQSR